MQNVSDNRTEEHTRVDYIARVVLKVINELRTSSEGNENGNSNRIAHFFSFVSSHWAIFIFLSSLISLLLGKIFYDLSLLQPIVEIARKDQQIKFKNRMVDRHIKLGISYLNERQLEEARKEFEDALNLDEINTEAQMGLKKIEIFELVSLREYDPAVVEKILRFIQEENENKDAHAFLFMGDINFYTNPDSALVYYRKAIEADSTLIPAASAGMGDIYTIQRKFDEAIQQYKIATSFSKWNLRYLDNLSYLYYLNKEFDQAINTSESIIKIDHRYIPAYYTLLKSDRMSGNLDTSMKYQNNLLILLSDDDVFSLKNNRGEWFFPTASNNNDNINWLTNNADKKNYAYYSLILTSILYGDWDFANQILDYIQEQNMDNIISIQDLLIDDIDTVLDVLGENGNESILWNASRNDIEYFRSFILEHAARQFSKETSDISGYKEQASWYVQLVALNSKQNADEYINYLQLYYGDLFEHFPLYTWYADLGPVKGIFYRVQTGPFNSFHDAATVCNELKSRELECFETTATQ